MFKRMTIAVLAALSLAGCARLTPLLGDMRHAENVVQTSGGRVFVSSNGALYELLHAQGKWEKRALPLPAARDAGAACYYLGMAESAGRLYVAARCPASMLYAIDLARAGTEAEVHPLAGVAGPNGLAADAEGRLYLADSGSTFRQGALYRFSITDQGPGPLEKVAGTESTRPNGVRIVGNRLYLSINPPAFLVGSSRLLRYDLASGGLSNPTELYRSAAFIDDFALVEDGLVVTRLFAGRIVHIAEDGTKLHQAAAPQPTSVAVLRAPLPTGALLVTDRWNHGVHLLQPGWGLRPR